MIKDIFKQKKESGIAFIPIIVGVAVFGAMLGVGKIAIDGYLPDWLGDAFFGVINALATFFMMFARTFFYIGTELFANVLSSDFIRATITRDNPIFQDGWAITRDFANMFIILGFVVVGIATILRLQEYQAQKVLLPLIIVAILVNFSPLLCGIIIDATNIATDYFLSSGGAGGMGTAMFNEMTRAADERAATAANLDEREGTRVLVQANVVSLLLFTVAGITFLLLALLFAARQVLLLALAVLAPIAFVSFPFKGIRPHIFDKWLKAFLEWATMGVTASFFIYLSSKVLTGGGGDLGGDAGITAFLIPMIYLSMAFFLSKGTKALGGAAIIGAGAAIGGVAMGAVKGSAGIGSSALKTGAKKAKDRATNRFVPSRAGTLDKQRETEMTGARKEIEGVSSDDLAKRAGSRPVSPKRRREKAASIEKLAESGDFDKIKDKGAAYAHVAQHSPSSLEKLEKADPGLAVLNKQKLGKIAEENNLNLNDNNDKSKAEEIAIQQTVDSLSPKEVGKLSAGVLSQHSHRLSKGQFKEGLKNSGEDKIKAAVKNVSDKWNSADSKSPEGMKYGDLVHEANKML